MNSILEQIVIYFSIIQSFFLTYHFFSSNDNDKQPIKILGWLLLTNGISVLMAQLLLEKWVDLSQYASIIFNIRMHANLLLMLLMYFYILSIFNKDFILWSKKNILYFIPIIISFGYFYFRFKQIPFSGPFSPNFFIGFNIYNLTYNLFYYILILSVLKSKFSSLKRFFSSENKPFIFWITFFIGNPIFFWVFQFVVLILYIVIKINPLHTFFIYLYTFLPFIFINTILFLALKKPKIFLYKKNVSASHTDESEQQEHLARLINYFSQNKAFTDQELSLQKVANELNLSSKLLSALIHEKLNQNFNDFVNSYRINESKELLIKNPEKTIQEIMYETGFNSKSVFNNHFKKITGHTPKEYRLAHKEKA
jgi:AraC-like DNA-binding protein